MLHGTRYVLPLSSMQIRTHPLMFKIGTHTSALKGLPLPQIEWHKDRCTHETSQQASMCSQDERHSLQGQAGMQGDVSGEETAQAGQTEVARRCCTCANMAHGAFCLFSAVAFFGILLGAPVYLYLVKLPSLACSAAI